MYWYFLVLDTSLCYSFWFFKIIMVILLVVLAFYIPKGHFGQGEKVYKIYLQVICLYYITKKKLKLLIEGKNPKV